jgi:hypothetical protein
MAISMKLRSYRYAWAEMAKKADYLECCAQEALWHKSSTLSDDDDCFDE